MEILNNKPESTIIASSGWGRWTYLLDPNGHIRGLTGDAKYRCIIGLENIYLPPKDLLNYFLNGLTDKSEDPTQFDYFAIEPFDIIHFTFSWLHPRKGLIYIEIAGTRHTNDIGEFEICGYAVDITEREEEKQKWKEKLMISKREAEIANQAKTTFLFNMSHDIRTPMNAIIGYSELIEKDHDNAEKCNEYIEKIKSSSKFLLSLIDEVLELARIESGNEQLEEKPYDAVSVLESIVDVFQYMMADKNIDFEHNSEIHNRFVIGDKGKLNKILLNLVSNAYNYTYSGGKISLKLDEISNEIPGWTNLRIIVADTGIGMSEEYQSNLFDKFSREHTSTENKIQGAGLGLTIVKKYVDLMDGVINVESKPGVGTCFTVTIPSKISEETKTQNKERTIDKNFFKGKRVLLAEDNDINAEIAEEILRSVGFEVERARDGQACVEIFNKAENGRYDVILMDIQMPNMNGYEATKTIRSMNKKRQIPILAMTANVFEADRKAAFAAGMNGHIGKPIDITKMMNTLEDTLK